MTDEIQQIDKIKVATNSARSNGKSHKIKLWDGNSFGKVALIQTSSPTGRAILEAFKRLPTDEHILIEFSENHETREIELDAEIDLTLGESEKYFAFHNDRTYKVSINDKRHTWGDDSISESLVRLLGGIDESKELVLELKHEGDRVLLEGDFIDLTGSSVEHVYSRVKKWNLNVQGVLLTFSTKEVVVRDALVQAGFDPNECWTAILKIKGEPKVSVELDSTIDLSKPGIEKLRLRPNEIKNGEGLDTLRRDFCLLEKDEEYLKNRNLIWETFFERKQRWLILRLFSLPDGYNKEFVDIAMDIPNTYPAAAMDMFYCSPSLTMKSGRSPDKTESFLNIEGKRYQRWSRHLNGATRWNPQTDSVVSHIAFIEDSLYKEVEQ